MKQHNTNRRQNAGVDAFIQGIEAHDPGRTAEIEALFQDIETHGVTIVGRKALANRLVAADDWRQDFIFWSRGGAVIGLAHIYDGPKTERKDREVQIQETMRKHGFTPRAAKTYTRLMSHPSLMAKVYAQGAITRDQMQTVEDRSLLHKIGAWLSGRNRNLLDQHEVDLADLRLVRRMIEQDPDTPAAREFLENFQLDTPDHGENERREQEQQEVLDQLGFGVSPHSATIRRMFR